MTALYDMSVKSNKSNLLDGAHTLKIVYSKYSGKKEKEEKMLKKREMKIDSIACTFCGLIFVGTPYLLWE